MHVLIADGSGINRARIQARAGGYVIYTDLAGAGQTSVLHSATGAWSGQIQQDRFARMDTEVEPSLATTSQATGARIFIYDLRL